MSNYKKFVVVADNHGYLASQEAVQKALSFTASWKPNYRIHLGDLWDFTPLRAKASQDELAMGVSQDFKAGIQFLRDYKPTHLTLGNHDDRLWQGRVKRADGVLREKCDELASVAEKEFRQRKIQYIPYCIDRYLQMPEGGPKLIHGFRATMYPARAHFENWGPCLHGHTHKADYHKARHVDGGESFSVPTLADISKMEYANRTPARLGWSNGFLYGIIHKKTGSWSAWSVDKKEDGTWISPMGEI